MVLDERGKETGNPALSPIGNNRTEAFEVSGGSSQFDKTFEYKTVASDNSLSQGSDSSPLSEVYEDAGDAAIETSAPDIKVKSLDISGLCFCIGNLCLDSPKEPEKSSSPLVPKDTVYNSDPSAEIPVPVSNTVVTNQPEDFADDVAGESTFVIKNNDECRLGVLLNAEIGNDPGEVESPLNNPVLLEAAKTFDSGVSSLEGNLSTLSGNNPNRTEIVKTDDTEVEFNKTVKDSLINSHQVVADSSSIYEELTFVLDADSKTSGSSVAHVGEPLLHTNVTDFVATGSILKSKSSSGLDSTRNSTLLEVSCTENKATSEFTETAVCNNKSESEASVTLTSLEVPEGASLIAAAIPANFGNTGTGDWKSPVEAEQCVEVEKERPAVLSELFEICSRQQKDLELSDEKFVDGTEFFTSPSKCEFEQSVEFTEFDQTIADEAEKILQEIINSSSEFHETGSIETDSRCASNTGQSDPLNSTENMADLRGVSSSTATVMGENEVSLFVSQTSLRRSPPSSGRPSPRSSSQVSSPCESPHTKSKLASTNAVKDGASACGLVSFDHSPNFHTGKNSPDCRISSNKVI